MDPQQQHADAALGEARRRGLGDLAAFPDEVVCYLLHSLDVRTLLQLSRASRLLRLLACEEPLWLAKHLERCARPFDYRGSWRATYLAHLPAAGCPQLTAHDLLPPVPVPGFSSLVLYRRWYRCHVDLSAFVPAPPGPAGSLGSEAGAEAATAAAAKARGAPAVAPGHQASSSSRSGSDVGSSGCPPAIPVVADAGGLSAEEFETTFDTPRQPVLLGGLTAGWAGGRWREEWQLSRLVERLGSRLFRVTKPFLAEGSARTRMRLADYAAYCDQQHDEEPLYIFDAGFGEAAPELLQRYRVPHLFRHDLLACLGYRREDYRWLVVGPARSGASWHVDPSATSAWNTLLSGRKRWALYPPGRTPPGMQLSVDSDGNPSFQSPTSLQWWLEVYPQLPPDQRPLEVVQEPGQTLFLPAGWWHAVLNLDLTVAITQNFVSPANLEVAVQWQALGGGSLFDERLAPAFLKAQQQQLLLLQRGQQNSELPQPTQQQEQAAEAAPPAKRRRHASGSLAACKPAAAAAAAAAVAAQGQHHPINGEEGGSEEREGAEEEAALAAHLKELGPGFGRDDLLAGWLRQLLLSLRPTSAGGGADIDDGGACSDAATAAQPGAGAAPQQQEQQQQQAQRAQRAERVWELAERWSEVAAWRPRLAAACRAVGLPPPAHRHEWLPLATGWCVTFEVHGTILKFYNPRPPHATAMGCIELAAYLSLEAASAAHSATGSGGSGSGSGSQGPLLLGAGLLDACGSSASAVAKPKQAAVVQAVGEAATAAEAAAEAVARAPLPFLAVRKSPGATLGSQFELLSSQQWLAVAAAVGASLADFHRLPLPAGHFLAPAAAASASAAASSSADVSTAWVARDGIVYGSAFGTLDMRHGSEGETLGWQRALLRQLFPSVAARLLGQQGGEAGQVVDGSSAATSARNVAAPAPGPAPAGGAPCRSCTAWRPFLSFLRRQRRDVVREHRRNGSLPPQLMDGLDSYLPADPALLLGSSGGGCSGGGGGRCNDSSSVAGGAGVPGCCCPGSLLPTWLHGDLTAENILVSRELLAAAAAADAAASDGGGESARDAQQQAQQASLQHGGAVLIDFADGGHGDPLWDFIPLLLRTFRVGRAAGEACLVAYCSAGSHGTPATTLRALPASWPRRPRGTSLSYVATCYALLHELDPLRDAFKRRPELWETESLSQLQAALFGWLDAYGGSSNASDA